MRLARRLTAEHGLSGFTIEELCEAAGVSRRTFFNYFPTKDAAILGLAITRVDSGGSARFLSGGDGVANGPAPELMSELIDLTVERWKALDITEETAADLLAALEREPRLYRQLMAMSVERERFVARLIEQREDLPHGDLRAAAAAQIIGVLSRATTEQFLRAEGAEPFEDILRRRMDAARELFALQSV
jgi:AcrR family transcriptional regulator